MPKKGDAIVRTADGARFTIAQVVEAGGEEVYHLAPEGGGDLLKITGASFVKEHSEDRPVFVLADRL